MNLDQTFSILFWLKKSKMNKQGLAPIWARVTVDGARAEFSTQKQIYPKFWDAENSVALKDFSKAKTTNDYLTLVRADLIKQPKLDADLTSINQLTLGGHFAAE